LQYQLLPSIRHYYHAYAVWYHKPMKIVRNDATVFEAKQGKATSIVVGLVFAIIGAGVLAIAILQPAGTVKQNAWVGVVVALIFMIVGVLVVLFTRSIHVLADRGTQTITITFKSLLNTKVASCNFTDVTRIAEISTVSTNGGNNQQVTQLLLKDGSELVIPTTRGGGFSVNGIPVGMFARHAGLGQSLATFLNVPFEPLGFGSVAGVQNTVIETVNAVKMAEGKAPMQPVVVPPLTTPAPPSESAIGVADQPGYAAIRPTQPPSAAVPQPASSPTPVQPSSAVPPPGPDTQ
jgi:hypothetical protein